MPTYSLTNFSDTEVQLTIDGQSLLFKKVYCYTVVQGDYVLFFSQQVETNAFRQQYAILYSDCVDPVAASSILLKEKIDFIINSYATYTDLVLVEVKNTSGGSLTKGTPVYITGTVGATQVLTIAAADASTSAKMPSTGLLYQDLSNNQFGHVIVTGLLTNITTSPIDGVVPTVNQTIYVKAGGGLTLTKPTGTNLIQNVGKVGRVNGGGAGSIAVANIQRTNDIPNIAQNNFWVGNASGVPTAVTMSGDVTNSAGVVTIANDAVTFAKIQNINTDRLLGRDTAGTGDVEELTVTGGIEFTGTGIQTSAFTGDVTKSAGGTALTIANDAVTYAKMQNVSAASKLLGRGDSGAGDVQEITLGTGLTMTGTTLSASGGGGGGITTLNTLTATTQTFATGTTGSDFNISSSTSTHTFNIPDAGASARGLVTTGTQTLAGAKTFSSAPTFSTMTAGSVLFAGTSGLLSQDNSNLFWDNTNKRLGIGTSTPLYRLEVKGSITASSALAQLVNFEPTLTASANNDFLVAANINATFSLGAFTGTSSHLQRWQTAGFTRSFIRSTGLQQWNLNSGTLEAGRIEYGTPSGNTGMAIFDYDTATSTYINRYNFANEGTYFYQGYHSINTLGGMALFNTSHNLVLGYTGTPTDAGYKLDVNGTTRTQGDFTISDAKNIILGTTTGTKIGTATSQKLSFWNATPIVQPTTAVVAATLVGGGGTTITATDTFDGYTLQQVVKALRNTGILA